MIIREQIGDHTLYLGDCLEVMKELPDKSIDAVVTDPPFKLDQAYTSNVDADNLEAVTLIFPSSRELLRVCKEGSCAAIFYDTRILPIALFAFRDNGWKYLRALTFYRRWGYAHILHGWMSTSDFVLLFSKPGRKPEFWGRYYHDTYVKETKEAGGTKHPAQKPEELCRQLVERLSPPSGIVLDPFMGSGTTGVACERLSRKFIGIEKERKYFDIACKRIDRTIKHPTLNVRNIPKRILNQTKI